jgi:plasmid replication DNA-binding protein KfrA
MMVRKNDILRVAQSMFDEGQNPTVQAIRDDVGGSNRDIAPILKQWRDRKRRQATKRVQGLVSRYEALDLLEKEVFRGLAELMELTPTEKNRRQSRRKSEA